MPTSGKWQRGYPNVYEDGLYDVEVTYESRRYRSVVEVDGPSRRVVDGYDFYGQSWWYHGRGLTRYRRHGGQGKVPEGSDKGSAFAFELPPKDGRWYVAHKGNPRCPRVVRWLDGDGYGPGYYDVDNVDHQMEIRAHLPEPVPE